MPARDGLRVRTRAAAPDAAAQAEVTAAPVPSAKGAGPSAPPPAARRTPSWRRARTALWAAFLVAWAHYAWVRATTSLDLGQYTWYAVLVFCVEMLGCAAVALFGMCACRRAPPPAGPTSARLPYHVHALVPCYTEAVDIVAETVWALHTADLPAGASRTVWLLDDGNDAAKAAWVAGLKTEGVRYVSGRPRGEGELNGKAANLNHALSLIYPPGSEVADTDAVAVFDADQVAAPDFFARALPPLAESPAVALVLTPQRFANVDDGADVFNHGNAHFWEAVLPGAAAWGAVVCTGSNLVLRAAALAAVGGFPERSVTEDHVLGMDLKAAGYEMRYVPRYLAVGEAPEQGAIFRQRSRWAKGHAAAFFSRADNPFLRRGLPLASRLVYASGFISFAATALAAPLLAVAPAVVARWGVAPAALTPALARALVPHVLLLTAVSLCIPCGPRLLRALVFNGVSGRLLWWTYAKATFNSLLRGVGLKPPARFKTTLKTGAAVGGAVGTPRAAPGTPRAVGLRSGAAARGGGGLPASPVRAGRRAPHAPAPAFDDDGGYGAGGAATGALERVITMPELLASLADRPGERPAWDVDAAPAVGDAATAEFGALKFDSLRLGAVRDVWAPVGVGAAAAASAVYFAARLATGTAPPLSALAALWGLAAACPPALLLLYTLGWRGPRLRAATLAALLVGGAASAAALAASVALAPPVFDYGDVLGKAYLFYDAQKSGPLGPANRVPWRGDSAMRDAGPKGVDLVGGFYDAGDHIKASLSIGVAASLLAWGVLEFPAAHAASGQYEVAAGHIRHAAEYLLKCHTKDEEFVGQVGDFKIDHDYWGRPEDMDGLGMARPYLFINATHPGSDLAAQGAAALAAASKVFETSDPNFARTCIVHSKKLYKFAKTRQGRFSDSVPAMGLVYTSTAYRDDLAWAATWIALASGERAYAAEAAGWLDAAWKHETERWYYYVSNWNNMAWNAQLLLARVTGDAKLAAGTRAFLDGWRLGRAVNVTRGGLAYADDWGTLRNSANSALLAFIYAKHVGREAGAPYECWAQSQLRYMLGDNAKGQSFVVGVGRKFPLQPHQRAASCPPPPATCNYLQLHSPDPNPHVLVGALVGGPHFNDTFPDDRMDYAKSEVGIEYNAGFTAALAGAADAATPWGACMQGGGLANRRVVEKKRARGG